MKITELKVNPDNPQIFDDLHILEKSISEFPKMMELRPMVYDPETMYVLGGNKRLICLINLGYEEIPENWVKDASGLTEHEKKRFILADNIGFGEWDLDILNTKFSEFDFDDLGLEIDYGVQEEAGEENESTQKEKGDHETDIDYDFPVAKELGFSDNYIIVTFKDNNEFDDFVNDNNIPLEKSANFESEKLVEFEHKRIFNYEDLHSIIKPSK